jgi:hypothetical protein
MVAAVGAGSASASAEQLTAISSIGDCWSRLWARDSPPALGTNLCQPQPVSPCVAVCDVCHIMKRGSTSLYWTCMTFYCTRHHNRFAARKTKSVRHSGGGPKKEIWPHRRAAVLSSNCFELQQSSSCGSHRTAVFESSNSLLSMYPSRVVASSSCQGDLVGVLLRML